MILAIVLVPDILISFYVVLLKTLGSSKLGILSVVTFDFLFYLAMLLIIQKKKVSISEKFHVILLAIFIKNVALFLLDTCLL